MNLSEERETIYPDRMKFTLAFFVYYVVILIPFILGMLLITRKTLDGTFLWWMPLIIFFLSVLSYSYYRLSKEEGNLRGATLWGWWWRREEIRLSEIDSEKVLRQSLGRQLGIVIIYSSRGKKILTLGLSDLQISGILESARKQRQTSQTTVAKAM